MNSNSIIIRSLVPSDFDQWSQLWEGYNLFYKRTLPEDIIQTAWKRFLVCGLSQASLTKNPYNLKAFIK